MLKKVRILDCDPGTDDAIALLIAKKIYKEPDYLISTFGNMPESYTFKNLVLLKRLYGLNSKIFRGEDKGLDGSIPTCGDFHGEDGIANLSNKLIEEFNLTEVDFSKEDNSYLRLKEELKDVNGIEYIVTGPLTTFSKIIEDEEIKNKISRVLIMGGGIKEFNKEHQTEYNFSGDPIAVKKVLESGLKIYLFTLDLTHKQIITENQIKELELLDKKPDVISILKYNMRSNIKYDNLYGAVLHDAMPVMFSFNEDNFKYRKINVVSDKWGHLDVVEKGNEIYDVYYLKEGFLLELVKESILN